MANKVVSQKQALALAAAGFGAVLAVRAATSRGTYSFNNKSALITGGSRGLGLVLARQLVAAGARVTLLARDQSELERAVADIKARNPTANVLAVSCDVGNRDDVERAIARAIQQHNTIDLVINNAGVIQVGPFDHMQLPDYDAAMRTHFWGPLYMILSALPHMRRQGGGRIVNISSIGGRIAVPHLLPYSASKFALTGLSDGLRVELARDNIAVTTVCPGLMRTGSPVNARFKGKRSKEYAWFAIADSLPLVSISAERAARQILAACRRGDAELVITPQAKLAIIGRTVAPEVFMRVMSLANRLLPGTSGRDASVAQPGRAIGLDARLEGLLSPMFATARQNNEL